LSRKKQQKHERNYSAGTCGVSTWPHSQCMLGFCWEAGGGSVLVYYLACFVGSRVNNLQAQVFLWCKSLNLETLLHYL
jgi:hypothetical protein